MCQTPLHQPLVHQSIKTLKYIKIELLKKTQNNKIKKCYCPCLWTVVVNCVSIYPIKYFVRQINDLLSVIWTARGVRYVGVLIYLSIYCHFQLLIIHKRKTTYDTTWLYRNALPYPLKMSAVIRSKPYNDVDDVISLLIWGKVHVHYWSISNFITPN